MPQYKFGKQSNILPFVYILEKVKDAGLTDEQEAYFWLLYYTGVRKSEAYERVVEDTEIFDNAFVIDFHKRKKGGTTVSPITLPRRWVGVELLVNQVVHSELTTKNVFRYVPQGKTWTNKEGKVIQIKERKAFPTTAKFLFPHIQSTSAWRIVKAVLGKQYYPHFLRLNRLSEIGSDPTANLQRMKSFSGIKSTSTLQFYLGVSKKEQEKALEWMNHQFREQ
jgi:hypothetical protein